MTSTALLITVLFAVIYGIVYATVFDRLNENIAIEAEKHANILAIDQGNIQIKNKAEWLEREHRTIEVNPVFIQIIDSTGQLVDKSPNLKTGQLRYDTDDADQSFRTFLLSGQPIRQTQWAITDGGKVVGHLLVAMSQEEAILVLGNLRKVLMIAFPLVLGVVFLAARFIAGRSIKPVSNVIYTANQITQENLSERIALPSNQDELTMLVVTINDLLDRIENAVEREKQFTSDASHELRTPLAVMKGTLEVLIRKPRSSQEYVDKVNYCIHEIDRMNHLVDQLLLLARWESQQASLKRTMFDLPVLIDNVIQRQQPNIREKQLCVQLNVDQSYEVYADPYLVDVILENLLSNAIKYSNPQQCITIHVARENQRTVCTLRDEGLGMKKEELTKVFDRFYRSEAGKHPQVRGTGLGLSIAQRMCHLLKIDLSVDSVYQHGTTVRLAF